MTEEAIHLVRPSHAPAAEIPGPRAQVSEALCLAHMDAHLKSSSGARAFLAGDLVATFNTRRIAIEVGTAQVV